ncbi:hypothetical protein COCNU_scaffold005738G000020 [Cocos nucifera]|nr:hypothetical protein [Cocos nucifera]
MMLWTLLQLFQWMFCNQNHRFKRELEGGPSKDKRKHSPPKPCNSKSFESQSSPHAKVIVREESSKENPGQSSSTALIVYSKGPARKEVWRPKAINTGSTFAPNQQQDPLHSSAKSFPHPIHEMQ